MKRFVLSLSFALLVSAEGWSLYQPSSIQRTLYISSSEGNDNNPGTRDLPRKTLASLSQQERQNSRVLLKCGDVFTERIVSLTGCEVSSYGRGLKPIVTGFFRLQNVAAWEQIATNIWRLDLSKRQNFTGFDYSKSTGIQNLGNIGLIYHLDTDRVFGNLVSSISLLQKDGDFFTTATSRRDEVTAETFRYLYFRWPVHPASLGNLCFSSGTYGCVLCKDCYIHDIAIIGFGLNGIQVLSGTTIADCNLDLIGGSILLDYPRGWMRFGNGIEVNVSRQKLRDISVHDNLISRTYDTATTIQGQPSEDTSPENIVFEDNTIVHCRQAFEWYINPRSPDITPQYTRCYFRNNLLLENGYNQFGIPTRPNDCQLLSYDQRQPTMSITGNIIYGGNYLCAHKPNAGIRDNKIYLFSDHFINHYVSANYSPIHATSVAQVDAYRRRMKDTSDLQIIEAESKTARRFRKQIRRLVARQAALSQHAGRGVGGGYRR